MKLELGRHGTDRGVSMCRLAFSAVLLPLLMACGGGGGAATTPASTPVPEPELSAPIDVLPLPAGPELRGVTVAEHLSVGASVEHLPRVSLIFDDQRALVLGGPTGSDGRLESLVYYVLIGADGTWLKSWLSSSGAPASATDSNGTVFLSEHGGQAGWMVHEMWHPTSGDVVVLPGPQQGLAVPEVPSGSSIAALEAPPTPCSDVRRYLQFIASDLSAKDGAYSLGETLSGRGAWTQFGPAGTRADAVLFARSLYLLIESGTDLPSADDPCEPLQWTDAINSLGVPLTVLYLNPAVGAQDFIVSAIPLFVGIVDEAIQAIQLLKPLGAILTLARVRGGVNSALFRLPPRDTLVDTCLADTAGSGDRSLSTGEIQGAGEASGLAADASASLAFGGTFPDSRIISNANYLSEAVIDCGAFAYVRVDRADLIRVTVSYSGTGFTDHASLTLNGVSVGAQSTNPQVVQHTWNLTGEPVPADGRIRFRQVSLGGSEYYEVGCVQEMTLHVHGTPDPSLHEKPWSGQASGFCSVKLGPINTSDFGRPYEVGGMRVRLVRFPGGRDSLLDPPRLRVVAFGAPRLDGGIVGPTMHGGIRFGTTAFTADGEPVPPSQVSAYFDEVGAVRLEARVVNSDGVTSRLLAEVAE